jgi:hypothetical protein
MKKGFIIKIMAIAAITLVCNSCTSSLKEEAYDFMSNDMISGSSLTNANLWVNGCLNTLNGGDYMMWGSYWTDETQDDDYFTGVSWAVGTIGAGNWYGNMDNTWDGPYLLINNCNNAIPEISNMSWGNDAQKNNCLGQVYFLKGWAYFCLVRAFGAVPIFTKGIAYGDSFQQPRQPVMNVYNYAIEMLQKADSLLYDAKDPNYEVGRLSKDAARGMLARVYLTIASSAMPAGTQVKVNGGPATNALPVQTTYNKTAVAGVEGVDPKTYFKLAEEKTLEVMNNGYFQLLPYNQIWGNANVNSKEHIWSLQAAVTSNLQNYIAFDFYGNSELDATGSGLSGGYYYERNHWYDLFENQDYRITEGVPHRCYYYGSWFYYPLSDSAKVRTKAQINNDVTMHYAGNEKYQNGYPCDARLTKFNQTSSPLTQYGDYSWSFMRMAEVYLTYAEAENELNGPTQAARDALNAVRQRNNASLYPTTDNSVVDFRSAVLEERAKELSIEGVRRWDLIRWGIYLDVMNAIGIDENNLVKSRQTKHLLFPIPLSEMNSNKLISQNPGW